MSLATVVARRRLIILRIFRAIIAEPVTVAVTGGHEALGTHIQRRNHGPGLHVGLVS